MNGGQSFVVNWSVYLRHNASYMQLVIFYFSKISRPFQKRVKKTKRRETQRCAVTEVINLWKFCIKVRIKKKRRQLYKVTSFYNVTYQLICTTKYFLLYYNRLRFYFCDAVNKNDVNITIWYCSMVKKTKELNPVSAFP